CLVIATTAVTPEPDYYWRDFDGSIPSDAVLGTNDQEVNTYVGNAGIYGGGLLIGQLFPNDSYITVTGKPEPVQTTDKFVKILCSQHPELLQWFPVNSDTFDTIPFHLVQGGWEVNPPIDIYDGIIHVGRVLHNNRMVIGKVIGYENGAGHWLYFHDGDEELHATEYEILVYDIPR
ncbi:hypothetical protein BDFB_013372, partial [Asbolus verrucosus]